MKIIKVLLTLMVIAAVATGGYIIYGAFAVVECDTESSPASEYDGVYDAVYEAVQYGTVVEAPETELTGAGDYELVKLNVTVKDRGILNMEWLTCEYTPAEGDAVVYAVTELPEDIPAGGEKTFSVQLLRHNGAGKCGKIELTYYVMGIEIKKTVQP